MIQDISKAYFFDPATRDIYIELSPEDAEPGMVGNLEKSLYGTRWARKRVCPALEAFITPSGT